MYLKSQMCSIEDCSEKMNSYQNYLFYYLKIFTGPLFYMIKVIYFSYCFVQNIFVQLRYDSIIIKVSIISSWVSFSLFF